MAFEVDWGKPAQTTACHKLWFASNLIAENRKLERNPKLPEPKKPFSLKSQTT